MRRYQSKKQYSWTPDLAYVAGLMASDGYMSKDERHMCLTSMDLEILNLTRRILELEVTIGTKSNGHGGYAFQIQFGNVSLYDFFIKVGIENAKSKTIKSVSVPDSYYPDFLRGVFDGDGSIFGFMDSRWANSLMFYTAFCSASPPFLDWLRTKNSFLAKVSPGSLSGINSKRVALLRYAKADSGLLFDFMYYDHKAPHLSRKYLKFIDFLTSDPYTSLVIRT